MKNRTIHPEMPLRLSKALVRSPERWLAMQDNHDLWVARQPINLNASEKIGFRVD
jgi:plasmid maintenance system antidote protein VapI